MQKFKQERITQILIKEINSMIVLGNINDPRVSRHVSVLHAKVSKDVSSATIYISSIFNDVSLDNTVNALNHAKGYIQAKIHKKYKWKFTPKLLFKTSNGLLNGQRLLDNLNTLSNNYPSRNTSIILSKTKYPHTDSVINDSQS